MSQLASIEETPQRLGNRLMLDNMLEKALEDHSSLNPAAVAKYRKQGTLLVNQAEDEERVVPPPTNAS